MTSPIQPEGEQEKEISSGGQEESKENMKGEGGSQKNKTSKVCENAKCGTDKTPLWRKGWYSTSGNRVRLCNACGLHYRKGHYCKYCNEIYRDMYELEGPEQWMCCERCEQSAHKKCAQKDVPLRPRYFCTDCLPFSSEYIRQEQNKKAQLGPMNHQYKLVSCFTPQQMDKQSQLQSFGHTQQLKPLNSFVHCASETNLWKQKPPPPSTMDFSPPFNLSKNLGNYNFRNQQTQQLSPSVLGKRDRSLMCSENPRYYQQPSSSASFCKEFANLSCHQTFFETQELQRACLKKARPIDWPPAVRRHQYNETDKWISGQYSNVQDFWSANNQERVFKLPSITTLLDCYADREAQENNLRGEAAPNYRFQI